MSDAKETLYERLGGYDAIAAVADDLLPRLQADPQLGRFWAHRGDDGVKREKQLLIDFLCASAGGPVYYRGRDMVLTHPRYAHQRERLERVPESCRRNPGEVPGARGRTARRGRVRAESQETDRRIASLPSLPGIARSRT
jgi:Bacterial-like globin